LASIALAMVGYMLWEHKQESKELAKEFVSVIKDVNSTNKEMVIAQRVMNCLISTDQKDRERLSQQCERNAR